MRLIKTIPVENVPAYWLLIGTTVGGAAGWFAGQQIIEALVVSGGFNVVVTMVVTIALFAFIGGQMMAFLAGEPSAASNK